MRLVAKAKMSGERRMERKETTEGRSASFREEAERAAEVFVRGACSTHSLGQRESDGVEEDEDVRVWRWWSSEEVESGGRRSLKAEGAESGERNVMKISLNFFASLFSSHLVLG